MRIIGIVGSPRRGGNTEFLVKEALNAAKEAGVEEIEMITLAEKTILPCNGCECCIETGECVIDDDMQQIYPKLLAADGIIFGAPVYMWGICGLAKVFIDRTTCLGVSHAAIAPRFRSRIAHLGKGLRDKVGGIVVVTGRVGGVTVFTQISNFFLIHRITVAGGAIAFGFQKGDVSKDEQGLNEARWTGKAVARALKTSSGAG